MLITMRDSDHNLLSRDTTTIAELAVQKDALGNSFIIIIDEYYTLEGSFKTKEEAEKELEKLTQTVKTDRERAQVVTNED